MKFEEKRVAIVADWLTSRGGAERVIFSLAKLFPEAIIFTSVYDASKFPELEKRGVQTTWLQKLPKFISNKHQFLLLFYPHAFQSLNLSEFDLIITSSSSGFSRCVHKTNKNQTHVCYCHTPVRFLYHAREEYVKKFPLPWWGNPIRLILPMLINWLTKIDQQAAKNVDYWVSNSDFIGKRIEKFYRKKTVTLHPGVETKEFVSAGHLTTKRNYFLAVGRFIPYKKFDLLVKTFIKNKLSLKLAGHGPEWDRCKSLAKNVENIEFLGFVPDNYLPKLYADARAFIFPAEEDFGLTPIEAMSAGTPVIYYDKGGAIESVGRWGTSFGTQSQGSLQKAIGTFIAEEKNIDREKIVQRGISFDEKNFRKNMAEFLKSL